MTSHILSLSFSLSLTNTLTHSLTLTLILTLTRLLVHSLIHSLTHLLTHSLTHTHSLIHIHTHTFFADLFDILADTMNASPRVQARPRQSERTYVWERKICRTRATADRPRLREHDARYPLFFVSPFFLHALSSTLSFLFFDLLLLLLLLLMVAAAISAAAVVQVYSAGVVTEDFSLAGMFGRKSVSTKAGPLHKIGHLSYGNIPCQRLHPQVPIIRQQDNFPPETSWLTLFC